MKADTKSKCQLCAAVEIAKVDNSSAIAIEDIPFSALLITSSW